MEESGFHRLKSCLGPLYQMMAHTKFSYHWRLCFGTVHSRHLARRTLPFDPSFIMTKGIVLKSARQKSRAVGGGPSS